MSLPMVLVAAQTNSFVVVAPLVTVVLPRAGVVTLPPTAVITVLPTSAHVALLAISPLTVSVVQMAKYVSTPATVTAALWAAGVEVTPSIAVLVVRRVSATVP